MSADIDLGRINRSAWCSAEAVARFLRHGWTGPGECAARDLLSAEVKDAEILDIGVGAGRTVPLPGMVSADYVGIDYTEELVAICRSEHPGKRIFHMDARDHSAFADEGKPVTDSRDMHCVWCMHFIARKIAA